MKVDKLYHEYDEPKRWQIHDVNEIMNSVVTVWRYFFNPRAFAGYGRQRGWERIPDSGNRSSGLFHSQYVLSGKRRLYCRAANAKSKIKRRK